MTQRQQKLVESYIRGIVRKTLKEQTLNESVQYIDTPEIKKLLQGNFGQKVIKMGSGGKLFDYLDELYDDEDQWNEFRKILKQNELQIDFMNGKFIVTSGGYNNY